VKQLPKRVVLEICIRVGGRFRRPGGRPEISVSTAKKTAHPPVDGNLLRHTAGPCTEVSVVGLFSLDERKLKAVVTDASARVKRNKVYRII
jgi:hypothetical protein